jgi:hypothetical protein
MVEGCKSGTCWGNNIVTIQGNGTIKTIIITKRLGGEVKRLEMLLCSRMEVVQ